MARTHLRLALLLLLVARIYHSAARTSIDPYLPGQVLINNFPLAGSPQTVSLQWHWKYKTPREWLVEFDVCELSKGQRINLTTEQHQMLQDAYFSREDLSGLEILVDLPFFQDKARKLQKGWHPGYACGNIEPYWGANTLSRTLEDVITLGLKHGVALSRTLVNVGAGDGIGEGQNLDPVWQVSLRFKMDALYIEPDQAKFSALKQNLQAQRPASVLTEATDKVASPPNVPKLIASSQMLRSRNTIDVLKIDIDVNDCDVAQAFLRERHAKLLVMEVNPMPPPVRFAQHAVEQPMLLFPLHGCSLSYMVELLAGFGLWLYRYDGQDALFVDASIAQLLSEHRGEKFPIDEFDCFRFPGLLPSTLAAPIPDLTHWFFNMPAAEQLQQTKSAALANFCTRALGPAAQPCTNSTDFLALLARLPMEFGISSGGHIQGPEQKVVPCGT